MNDHIDQKFPVMGEGCNVPLTRESLDRFTEKMSENIEPVEPEIRLRKHTGGRHKDETQMLATRSQDGQ